MDSQRQAQIILYGKAFARDGDMWAFPAEVIDAELDFLQAANAARANLPVPPPLSPEAVQEQNYLRLSFSRLTSIYDGLAEELAAQGLPHKAIVERLYIELTKGAVEARTSDTHVVKDRIPFLYAFSVPLAGVAKADRGYHHPATRYLMFPVSKKLSPNNANDMNRVRAGLVHIGPDTMYHFMYEDCMVNAEQPYKGLLRSRLLVKCWWTIFFGPLSALRRDGEVDTFRRGRKCNAYRNNITRVSMRSIAYVATLARFALSSDTSISPGNPRPSGDSPPFTYYAFYRSLVSLLESPNPNSAKLKFRTELLEWWNTECFTKGPYNRDDGAEVGESTSFADMFDAEEAA
ncbi:hypothetical protein BOTBODRAFT_173173 [Botryobasidium botryosum FD-172 SS1]|uniref:Uncharacterized protein n=1 Tax=Botryobasidium botryosum (strain FD-172 SS1) TaxID=930990 RepID=A0A067MXJ8_BOTB1|nr:hypothetical protein BOTBODRAFT_173173 [Botryobasidium botryosum FD-172 SS1]